MKGILANLLIKLGLDSKEFEQGIGKAKKETSNFASGLKAIGGLMAGAFAVETIKAFFTQLISFAKESIKIENELGAAIRANGKDVESTMSDYKRFANEMQNVTTMEDDAILSLIRLAETLQSSAPKEAAKNAIALSKAIGVDLNTAVKMAVMAQSDMYTMLSRYAPAIRDASNATERAAAYNKLLAVGVQILNDEVNTNIGKAEQLKVKWDNIKEGWGVAILESNALAGSIKLLGNYTEFYTSKQIKWWEKLIATIDITGNVYRKGLAKIELEKSARKSEEGERAYLDSFTKSVNKRILSEEELAEIEKKRLELLTKQSDEYTKQAELIQSIEDTQRNARKKLTDKYDPNKGLEAAPEIPIFELPEEADEKGSEIWMGKLEQWKQNFEAFKQDFAYMVEDFSVEVVDQLGAAFGELIKTGDFPADFGKNILSIIGAFISQLGKMLIGLGVASEAFQALLKSAFTSPVSAALAIAAGAGLVLLGGAIKGFAKAGPAGSGSSGGSGSRITSQPYSMAMAGSSVNSNKYAKIEVNGFLKGDSIYLSNSRNTFKRSLIG